MEIERNILRIEFGPGTDNDTGAEIPVATFVYSVRVAGAFAPELQVTIPWSGDIAQAEQAAEAQLAQFAEALGEDV